MTAMGRRLVLLGAGLVMAGMLTGFVSGALANPRMGLVSHLEGLMNGTLMIALGAAWGHVRLSASPERWAWGLLLFGTVANWFATLLAAVWGVGSLTMPLTAAGHTGADWQEWLVGGLLFALSFAMVGAFALVIRGVLAGRE